MTDTPLHLAIDSGPLHGHRTGVGTAAAGMIAALRARDDVVVEPYLVSFRASPASGEHRLPLPGIAASHLWSRSGLPRADRWLTGADVVHGTNYVAPPSSLPTVVSVYDCWFLRHPLLGTERVRTIHLGAPDVTPWSPDDPTPAVASRLGARPAVVCIATEERRKGLPLLVEAFAALAGDVPEVALVLAGAPGDDTSAIDRAVADAGTHTAGRIVRLGRIDDATKRWLLERATLLVYPSLDEGFGFPVLEANTLGVPVVATAVGSIPEVAGSAARLVPGRHPIQLAEAIEEVLADGAARRRLVTAGHANVDRFSWHDTAARLVELYRLACDERRNPR
jgi:glycosyltransferase involved in cell wall biosynthesis